MSPLSEHALTEHASNLSAEQERNVWIVLSVSCHEPVAGDAGRCFNNGVKAAAFELWKKYWHANKEFGW